MLSLLSALTVFHSCSLTVACSRPHTLLCALLCSSVFDFVLVVDKLYSDMSLFMCEIVSLLCLLLQKMHVAKRIQPYYGEGAGHARPPAGCQHS